MFEMNDVGPIFRRSIKWRGAANDAVSLRFPAWFGSSGSDNEYTSQQFRAPDTRGRRIVVSGAATRLDALIH